MITWFNDHNNRRHYFKRDYACVFVKYELYTLNATVRGMCDRLFRVMARSNETMPSYYHCVDNVENIRLFEHLYAQVRIVDGSAGRGPVVRILTGSILA